MGTKFYNGVFWLSLAFLTGGCLALESSAELEVEVVEDGTIESIVLDCPFTLSEEEIEEGNVGLMIKWFHSTNPISVYQWIEGYEPATLGILKDRVDLKYEAGSEDYHMHRAIKILNPSTDVSGDYKCIVSTFDEEITVPRKLVVYVKPTDVNVWAKPEGEDHVKVGCEVNEVFPEPEVSLFRVKQGDEEMVAMTGVKTTPSWNDGLYSAKVELIEEEDNLEGPHHFECVVSVPHTEVVVVNRTYYEPRVNEHAGAVKSGSNTHETIAILLSLALVTLWRI